MSDLRIGNSLPGRLIVENRRTRQTPADSSGFERVLRGGAQILLSGAAAATKVVGLPALSAAISRVQADARADDLTGWRGEGGGGLPLADLQQTLRNNGLRNNGQGDEDVQLLVMQDQIQRHNRQIALVSNVLKSQHDTAKSAIGNMRA